MKAVVLLGGNERGTLEIPNVPEPKLGTQELLIRALMHSFLRVSNSWDTQAIGQGFPWRGVHTPKCVAISWKLNKFWQN